ncbi:hypothetical protein OHA21_52635 [Actinoplanes sp. NBC_00393]|uniref:hypothetical protein n=1 Tax=Actinoplanes sp. NBC_00393 TaxID=2975953 RepID=UPI002E1E6493
MTYLRFARSDVFGAASPGGDAYVQQVLRDLIILGPDFAVDKSCDDALLSATVREQAIAGPVREAVAELPESAWWIRADPRTPRRANRRRRVLRNRR